jgi:hypothetical protein
MTPSERGMTDQYKAGMESTLDRLLSPMGGTGRGGRASGGSAHSGSDNYEYKEINAGGLNVIGAFDKRTGRFIEQTRYTDPKSELDIMKLAADINKTTVDTEAVTRGFFKPESIGAGNSQQVEKRLRVPTDWAKKTEEERGAWLKEQSKSMALPNASIRFDDGTGDLVFTQSFSDIKPTGAGGETKDPRQEYRIKLSIKDQEIANRETEFRNAPLDKRDSARAALQKAKGERDKIAIESNVKTGTKHSTGSSTVGWISAAEKDALFEDTWNGLTTAQQTQAGSKNTFRNRLYKQKGWKK